MNETLSGSFIKKYTDAFSKLGILKKLHYSQKFDYVNFVLTKPT